MCYEEASLCRRYGESIEGKDNVLSTVDSPVKGENHRRMRISNNHPWSNAPRQLIIHSRRQSVPSPRWLGPRDTAAAPIFGVSDMQPQGVDSGGETGRFLEASVCRDVLFVSEDATKDQDAVTKGQRLGDV
jgi:hypothetical protein